MMARRRIFCGVWLLALLGLLRWAGSGQAYGATHKTFLYLYLAQHDSRNDVIEAFARKGGRFVRLKGHGPQDAGGAQRLVASPDGRFLFLEELSDWQVLESATYYVE